MNDDDFDDFEEGNYFSSAWLLEGITGAVYGHLELTNGRLSFTVGEKQIFNVPLSEVKDVVFPWYYFSGGVKFRIGAEKYRMSFVQPGEQGSIIDGRQTGKAWKSLLQGNV